MGMTEILRDALDRVHGARVAGVIAADGLGVELQVSELDPNLDSSAFEIELSTVAATASMAAARMGAGRMRDFMIEADDLTCLASLIAPGYYAVLGMTPNGNLGRARFAVRQMVERLQQEL